MPCAFAQTGKVIYNYNIVSVKKNSNGANGYTKGELYFNDTMFIYYELNPNIGTGYETKQTSENSGTIQVKSPSKYLFEHIHFIKTKEDFIYEMVLLKSGQYKKKDSIPVWDLMTEKKQIGKYTCQKAVTQFCGRLWIAWFTTELPYPFGPWKLHGLPGLILEANDVDNKYSFDFISINMPDTLVKSPFFEEVQKGNIKLEYKEFVEQKKKYYTNLESKGRTIGGEKITNGSFKIGETRDIDF